MNVIELLINKEIPLIVLQMQALRVGEHLTLAFTRVLGKNRKLKSGITDENEGAPLTNRAYWENKKGIEETMALANEVLEIARSFDPTLKFHYDDKKRIILACDGRPSEFMTFRPQQRVMRLGMKIEKSEEIDEMINSSTIKALSYRTTHYRISLNTDMMKNEREIIEKLVKLAFDQRNR